MCSPAIIEIHWTVNLNNMSRISLKFTKKDGKFCLCALVKGTQVRHYKVVNVLTKLLEEYQFESGNDLFAMHDLAEKNA